jgi:hypothetical protein
MDTILKAGALKKRTEQCGNLTLMMFTFRGHTVLEEDVVGGLWHATIEEEVL